MRYAALILIVILLTAGCFSHPSSAPVTKTIATPDVPAFEILSKTGTCKSTDTLYIEGTVRNNGNLEHTLIIRGAAYDTNDVKLGTGLDYVDVDAHGISKCE